MSIEQYHVYLINLDPTIGHEIKKTRPCLVISPDEMNRNINTVIIASMTTKSHKYPTIISLTFQNRRGWIVIDQVRTIDKKRILKRLGKVSEQTIIGVKKVLQEMLVD